MMSPDELRTISRQLRGKQRQTDDDLVKRIAVDVDEYREVLARHPVQLPPAPLDGLLPLMGWLIYEATWDAVQRIVASFDRAAAEQAARAQSEAELARIDRLADCARRLPWPEFAPRALGALRALALAESKRDTETGYDAAWVLHEEAKKKYDEFLDCHGGSESGRWFVLSLDEVFVQLALAETGTACRTAERVIARWSEQFDDPQRPEWTFDQQRRWIQRMFRELTDGLAIGEQAIETVDRIARKHGFTDEPDEHRLTRRTARQNPGIMTARAASLLLALPPAMKFLGREPPREFDSWPAWEDDTLRRFRRAYDAIEAEVLGPDRRPVPMDEGFRRQLVHVRLNLALLKPGSDLPSARAADLPCLGLNPLDEAAVAAMSAWLSGPDGRGRERALGAATMPLFIRSVVACRGLGPADDGYQSWRLRWFKLDQYADEPGRVQRVRRALAEADRAVPLPQT